MPKLFKVESYTVYQQVYEGNPVEPVHVHVTEGAQSDNATKIQITQEGKCSLAHNNSRIPLNKLRKIQKKIEEKKDMIMEQWEKTFHDVHFYC